MGVEGSQGSRQTPPASLQGQVSSGSQHRQTDRLLLERKTAASRVLGCVLLPSLCPLGRGRETEVQEEWGASGQGSEGPWGWAVKGRITGDPTSEARKRRRSPAAQGQREGGSRCGPEPQRGAGWAGALWAMVQGHPPFSAYVHGHHPRLGHTPGYRRAGWTGSWALSPTENRNDKHQFPDLHPKGQM